MATTEKYPIKKVIYTILALFIVSCFRFIPAPDGLTADAMQVVGVFVGVLLLWITIGIDWPSLLCIAALGFVPSIGVGEVLKTAFGNATFAFLLFTFMCTYALSQTSVVKKIAVAFVTSNIAKKGPWHLAVAFLSSVLIIGLVMSPTVLFFIMLPILEEIYGVLKLEKGDKFARILMIGLVTCSSLSSGMTPIAHVFPVLAIGVFETATGTVVSYANYMAFAIPCGIILFAIMMVSFKYIMKPEVNNFRGITEEDMAGLEITQTTKRERYVVLIFLLVVVFWILPGIIGNVLPGLAATINRYGTAMPPLIGVIIMAVIRVDNKPLLNMNEAMVKGVSWPSLIMSASTLALGSAMTNQSIGLTAFITTSILPITTNVAPVLLILLFVTWAAVQSNVSSHMVTAQLVASIAVPIAISGGSISAAAIASVIGMVASIGSATPPSMPYVAIAGASGWTDAKELMKYGFIIMVSTIIVTVVIGYPLAAALMG